jgi:hypothetical protein
VGFIAFSHFVTRHELSILFHVVRNSVLNFILTVACPLFLVQDTQNTHSNHFNRLIQHQARFYVTLPDDGLSQPKHVASTLILNM